MAELADIQGRIRAAHDMVHSLCQPHGTAEAREWVMSIPARPDYDPDIVIGAALRDAAHLVRVAAAARLLLARLDIVEASDEYRRVWQVAQLHEGPYQGPTFTEYRAELAALLEAD